MTIDTRFDFRTDSNGKDPDSHSPTLRSYQRYLYSKPLPNGEVLLTNTLRIIDATRISSKTALTQTIPTIMLCSFSKSLTSALMVIVLSIGTSSVRIKSISLT